MAPARRSLHSSSAKKSANVTYQHQDVLPCLPIPSISSTATKFLDSARPFVSDPAPGAPVASDANPTEEYTRLKAVVKDFESSEFVQELQKRLEEHAKGKDNWLIDWFNEANYFGESSYMLQKRSVRAECHIPGYRDAIIPWVNYYYIHKVGPHNTLQNVN